MDDLISRQALLAEYDRLHVGKPGRARKMIEDAPSAEQERKHGHWKTYVISMLDGEGCKCSECGVEGVPYWDFCPSCGADMRGEQDDSI